VLLCRREYSCAAAASAGLAGGLGLSSQGGGPRVSVWRASTPIWPWDQPASPWSRLRIRFTSCVWGVAPSRLRLRRDVADGFAFVAADSSGLQVVDVSDPTQPVGVDQLSRWAARPWRRVSAVCLRIGGWGGPGGV